VSVVTATWRRPQLLLGRCLPSVERQTWPAVEHIVVSDGPDPPLAHQMAQEWPGVIFECLPEWVPAEHSGVRPRLRGLELAKGEFVAYLDDDDSFRPGHCELLARALLDHPEAGFAYSRMASWDATFACTLIGTEKLGPCAVGTPMIMHRRALTEIATWGPPDPMEDWKLVARWLQRLVKPHFVDKVTVDAWPSSYRAAHDYAPEGT
jgi:glycosyltransferase involved in cell wall biosynthesis